MLVDMLFGVTIATLFSGFNQHFGGVKVQLSDVLAAITLFVVALKGFTTPRIAQSVTFFLLLYLFVFCVSAFQIGVVSGLKECVQAALLFSFMFGLFGYYRTHSSTRLLKIATALIAILLAYNIAWHVSQGFYVGWKQLNEPKTIFIILPLLMILLTDRFGQHRRTLLLTACVLAAAIIILSGERKAYVFAAAALAIWTGWRSLRYFAAAILLAPFLFAATALDRTGYVSRQLGSLASALTSEVHTASASELIDVGRSATFSDSQREFTRRFAESMWKKKPVLGIGTGAYAQEMERHYSLPEAFRVGIHGEFYRALFENGILGLALYTAYWIATTAWIIFTWKRGNLGSDRNLNRIKLTYAFMVFIYCATEASKGLTLAGICALPFILAIRPSIDLATYGTSAQASGRA